MSEREGRTPVVIIDDHTVVRHGLQSMLEGTDFEVVGLADNGTDGLEAVEKLKPGIVLLDVRMPDMDGLSALQAIKRKRPETAVVMVTTYDDPSYLVRAIGYGAAGYLLKGIRRDELLSKLRALLDGESIVDQERLQHALARLIADSPADAGAEQPGSLTEREVEVLALVAQGLSNRQIGGLLGIAEGTVQVHVHRIIQKLEVSDRTQAAVWGVRHGLLK